MSGSSDSPTLLRGFGMDARSPAVLRRPGSVEELVGLVRHAAEGGRSIAFRGAGRSYGDAALNRDALVVSTGALRRILDFDEQEGVVTTEPGVTIEDLWRRALPRGFWPRVVPGTMRPTLAGCLAMNVHGKNAFKMGTIGRHVLDFDLLGADGEIRRVSREEDPALFGAVLGGFGMFGAITRLRLKLERVHSGRVAVRPVATATLREMIAHLEERRGASDYLVGWVDALGGGRGLVHEARYLAQDEDPQADESFAPQAQDLPSRLFGVVPKSWLWPGLWAVLNRPGMRLVNALKYRSGVRHARAGEIRQSLVGFSFLLDYVPRWQWAYRPGGLVQYQSFVPRAAAEAVFTRLLELCREHDVPPFLGVLKRHRAEPDFLLSHAVDGYSLALDLPISERRRARVRALARVMDEVVIAAGGRFYFAKDALLEPETLARVWPAEEVQTFLELKRRLDPGNLFRSDLARRLGLVPSR